MTEKNSNTTSKKGKILPWATAIMLVVGGAVLAGIYWNKNISVNEVTFSGNKIVNTNTLYESLDITLGVHPDSLNLASIVQKIETIDYVKNATSYVEPNGNLIIRISERTPIGILTGSSNKVYVDKYGVKLPIKPEHTFDVPLVHGFDSRNVADTLKSDAFIAIKDFLTNAKTNEFGWITISEVAYSQNDGVVALSQENGVKLLFGKNDFPTKLENWEAFYTNVVRTKGISSMQQVDLRFINQVVTKEI